MNNLNYFAPNNLEVLLNKLQAPESVVLAGGTDLLIRTRDQDVSACLVDISKIPDLKAIEFTEDRLSIGSAVTMSEIVKNNYICEKFPALNAAAYNLGSRQIRNMATIGGNIANASPAGDTLPALLVYEAELLLVGPRGERKIALQDFFLGPGCTQLEKGEIIYKIVLPLTYNFAKSVFKKYSLRQGMDVALVNGSASITVEGNYRVAFGGVAPTPVRLKKLESELDKLLSLDDKALRDGLLSEISPIDDIRATKVYRQEIAFSLLKRILEKFNGGY